MKSQQATLLSEPDLALEEDKRIGKLLSFFGVRHRRLSIAAFLADSIVHDRTAVRPGIFTSAEIFLRLIECLERNPDHLQTWCEGIRSVFVYPAADRDSLQKLARILIGNEGAVYSPKSIIALKISSSQIA